ncbi:MAG: PAS domain-containing protein [Bacteroidetes bacterium]|nr:PAS domain-containing protein [Bacteroidota bacterium]MBL6942821.1 PAS domain-containing protein [Bacteroidales bacterium]
MQTNKTTIRKKLIIRGQIILLLILLMIAATQIVVNILKKTSNEFVIEYHEINAIQELKLSLYQLLIQANKYSFSYNPDDQTFFLILTHQAHQKLSDCKQIITKSHSLQIIDDFSQRLQNIENFSIMFFSINKEDKSGRQRDVLEKINQEINDGLNQLDIILIETNLETEAYAKTNKTVFKHSTYTMLILGVIIVLVFIIGGLNFINNLTKPIQDFVDTTERIISGDRNIKVNINTGDEFSILANSFNLMLDSLEKTTVSKSYLDNILKNMFDSLIVTDNKLMIRSINESASSLLGLPKSWYKGKSLSVLFGKEIITQQGEHDINSWKKIIKNMDYFLHSSGNSIPALISCATLKNDSGKIDGLVIVGHDLTVKKEIEQKLEHSRKQRQIDINEAQEEERMRIASDLHDGLGQMLTAISYTTEEFQYFDKANNDEREKLINKMVEQLDHAIKESKNIAQNLIPIVLKDFGLIVAINNLINRANEMYDINFSFNAFDYKERIDVKLEKALYRICQESLNNIVKHSMAKNANYQIFKQDDFIVMVIDDDGIGFKVELLEEQKGIGLISMRERVNAFEGNFSIDSQIGEGTEIIIEIPCIKS